jgi:hypothetical protein
MNIKKLEKSIAFKAGEDAKAAGLPLERTAFAKLREGTKQYSDFLDGYESKPTRGGARPNAGAPKKAEIATNRTIRLTDTHWDKFKAVGGVPWLRNTLEDIEVKKD